MREFDDLTALEDLGSLSCYEDEMVAIRPYVVEVFQPRRYSEAIGHRHSGRAKALQLRSARFTALYAQIPSAD